MLSVHIMWLNVTYMLTLTYEDTIVLHPVVARAWELPNNHFFIFLRNIVKLMYHIENYCGNHFSYSAQEALMQFICVKLNLR